MGTWTHYKSERQRCKQPACCFRMVALSSRETKRKDLKEVFKQGFRYICLVSFHFYKEEISRKYVTILLCVICWQMVDSCLIVYNFLYFKNDSHEQYLLKKNVKKCIIYLIRRIESRNLWPERLEYDSSLCSVSYRWGHQAERGEVVSLRSGSWAPFRVCCICRV